MPPYPYSPLPSEIIAEKVDENMSTSFQATNELPNANNYPLKQVFSRNVNNAKTRNGLALIKCEMHWQNWLHAILKDIC